METVNKVKINYDFYLGEDNYSDGDIENVLLDYVRNEKDPIKILLKDNRWPILYHISPVRQNILRWYPFDNNSEVLEIGSGCGAVTGVICEKTKSVTCVELSKRRSLINANRNSSCDNLSIIVGNFNDVILNKKYDYITLVGVLEYASYFTDTKDSFVDFLKKIKGYLKPEGSLLIAIENKFGLKYFNGACEDHTGIAFDGIEGYHKTDALVRTFSKDELRNIIIESGFSGLKFYYPFPDYKFPTMIFSDEYMPKKEDLQVDLSVYDNDRISLFNEELAYAEIIKAGKFDFFSNSFFVEVKNKGE